VAVHVDGAHGDDLECFTAFRQATKLAGLGGGGAAREGVDHDLGSPALRGPFRREQLRAVAVQMLDPGETGRLMRPVCHRHFMTARREARDGGLADRSRAADEQDAHEINREQR
jgi:hypothetical protein